MRFDPEDFIVEEIPLYDPSDIGTHTFFSIRKRHYSTFDAIKKIASILHVNHKNIGYAGLKDKHAITTQVLSVEGISPDQILKIDLPSIEVLWARRHQHKLRVGHLRGNRFTIMLRNVPSDEFQGIHEKMECLAINGVPNRFGSQRFGNKQDTHLIGKALICGNWEKAIEHILTENSTLYSHLSEQLDRELTKITVETVMNFIPYQLRKLYLSAYQAYLFNCILEKRIPHIGKLLDGDIAIKHINSALFLVENASHEQTRADDFEISPTGPIFGYKMKQPFGVVEDMEMQLLSDEGVKFEVFRKVVGIRLPGTRRSLRMSMEIHQILPIENALQLSFTLPAGGYATVVLDELL